MWTWIRVILLVGREGGWKNCRRHVPHLREVRSDRVHEWVVQTLAPCLHFAPLCLANERCEACVTCACAWARQSCRLGDELHGVCWPTSTDCPSQHVGGGQAAWRTHTHTRTHTRTHTLTHTHTHTHTHTQMPLGVCRRSSTNPLLCSFMCNHKNLGAWTTDSSSAHFISKTPTGRYEWSPEQCDAAGICVPTVIPWSHNTVPIMDVHADPSARWQVW
jgi:hypothetical protein